MIFIALKDNKIIHVCETQSEDKVLASMQYEGIHTFDEIKHIPNDYFQGAIGNDIREFNAEFELLTLSQRKDFIHIPAGMKIEGDKFIEKTLSELIDCGDYFLPESEKYDEELNQIRLKTFDELLAENIITKEQWFESKMKECFLNRRFAYSNESDSLKNECEFDGKDLQVWRDKVSEIKNRYPKPSME